MRDRPSAVQIEPPPAAGKPASDPPESFDVRPDTKWSLTTSQLYKGAGLIAVIVLAGAALLPSLLPKSVAIATQGYVETTIGTAKADARAVADAQAAQIKAMGTEVGQIKVKVVGLQHVQHKARASQEADRVTRHIRNGDRRVAEYARIYEAGLRNQKAQRPREPLDGVRLPR